MPSGGERSILKSPVWTMVPIGVSMARATQSTSEWVTRMGTMVKAPRVKFSPGTISMSSASSRGVLFELAFDVGEGELGAVDGDVELGEDPGKSADVVFVAMGEDDGADVLLVLDEVGDIGDDDVDAEELGLGEHEAGIDDDDVVFLAEGEAVHTELAESA